MKEVLRWILVPVAYVFTATLVLVGGFTESIGAAPGAIASGFLGLYVAGLVAPSGKRRTAYFFCWFEIVMSLMRAVSHPGDLWLLSDLVFSAIGALASTAMIATGVLKLGPPTPSVDLISKERTGIRRWAMGGAIAAVALVLATGAFTYLSSLSSRGIAAFEAGDYEAAMRSLSELARSGDPIAQYYTGLMYSEGLAVEVDLAEARKWFEAAAEQGHPGAGYELGLMYAEGQGTEADQTAAEDWFRWAAERKDPDAQYALGAQYTEQGMEEDFANAAIWLRKAAEQNHALAMELLGVLFITGDGVDQDYSEAVYWLSKAVELGATDANLTLGLLYGAGEGVPRDPARAAAHFRSAAEAGQVEAAYLLGGAYYRGDGVPRDYEQAAHWYRLAAEQGHMHAQSELGDMYMDRRSVFGNFDDMVRALARGRSLDEVDADFAPLGADYAEAARWHLLAAEQGHPWSQLVVGVAYKGRRLSGILPPDESKALEWLRRAAEQGEAQAMYELGDMLKGDGGECRYVKDASAAPKGMRAAAMNSVERSIHEGDGVTKVCERPADPEAAAAWFRRAAELGNPDAMQGLSELSISGKGVQRDLGAAERWAIQAAEHGYKQHIDNLLAFYVVRDFGNASKPVAKRWRMRLATEFLDGEAMYHLGLAYAKGQGLLQGYVQGYMWLNLAGIYLPSREQAEEHARLLRNAFPRVGDYIPTNRLDAVAAREELSRLMTAEQIAYAQALSQAWEEEYASLPLEDPSGSEAEEASSSSSGTGFAVSSAGHVVTNQHVVEDCSRIETRGPGHPPTLRVVAEDPVNDLALLELDTEVGSWATFRTDEVSQGERVIALGFPLVGLLASGPTVTTGTVAALAGVGNDTRFLQFSAPIQPGNSGGPLLDDAGNVVGLVVASLDATRLAEVYGVIPQNVNFAIKASVVRAFLDANGVDARDEPQGSEQDIADVVARAKKFTVFVECWE